MGRMSQNCDKFRYSIDLYVDGQLDRPSQYALETHLGECRQCWESVQARRTLILRVRRFERKTQAPPALLHRIRRGSSAWRAHSRFFKWTAAVVMAFALALLGFFYAFPGWTPGQLATLEGNLICMGKKLEERYRVHWDCGNYGHLPILETRSGELWHLVNNQAAHELAGGMTDDSHPRVRVIANVYAEEHFLEIRDYQHLPDLGNQKGEIR